MYTKLSEQFKCPKWIKIMMASKPRSEKLGLYDAHNSYLINKKKSLKSNKDKAE